MLQTHLHTVFIWFLLVAAALVVTLGLYAWRRFSLDGLARQVALAQMGEGILVVDKRSRIVQTNLAAARLLDTTAAQLIGRDLTGLAWAGPGLLAQLRPPGETPSEITLAREAGPRQLQISAAPLAWGNGRPRGRLIFLRDVTEARQAEEALRASEARYRIVADYTSDWTFWLSPEGQIRYMSPACERMTGYGAEEFEREPELLSRIVHPDDRGLWAAHREGVEQKLVADTLEYRVIRQDGVLRWVFHACRPIVDDAGRFLGTRGSNRDITKRKLAEEALLQAHAELNAVFWALPDLYFRIAADGTILDYRAGHVTDLYVPPESFLGRRMPDLLPDNVGQQLAQAIQQVLATGQRISVEYALPMPGGTRYYEARLSPCLRDQVVAVIRNISEHREMLLALQEAHGQLEARVAERTAELVQVNERLNQEVAERQRAETELRALNLNLEQRVNDRTRELAALYNISAAATHAGSFGAFLEESLAQTAAALRSEAGIIMLIEPEGAPVSLTQWRLADHQAILPELLSRGKASAAEENLLTAILQLPRPLLIPNMADDPRIPAAMRTGKAKTLLVGPLKADDQTLGAMGLTRDTAQTYNVEEVALFATIADQVGVAVRSHRLRQVAQQATLLGERQRLARDLHNSVTQNLYGLVTFAEAGLAQLEIADFGGIHHTLERIGETTRQVLREMRLFIHQLRPEHLAQEGLVGALHLRLAAVEGRADIRTDFRADEAIPLALPLENALYQVAQEALNNVLRHAHATAVTVALRRDGSQAILEVTDNGCGFDPLTVGCGGMGLAAMREAMQEVGGDLAIVSAPGAGTRVTASVEARDECLRRKRSVS